MGIVLFYFVFAGVTRLLACLASAGAGFPERQKRGANWKPYNAGLNDAEERDQ